LGDRYVSKSLWRDVFQYNYARAYTYFMLARKAPDFETKIGLLSKADELDPQAYWFDSRASTYRKQKQNDEAITWYLKAIEQDPEFDNSWWNLATLYNSLHRYQDALDVIELSRQYGINETMRDRLDKMEITMKSQLNKAGAN
jgi:tetratricopeptide (TPR) repeat protein